MTKIREILEKYLYDDFVELAWNSGGCIESDECILKRDFDKLEKELHDWITNSIKELLVTQNYTRFLQSLEIEDINE